MTSMEGLDSIRHALAGRYTIERELGRGGNAVVYLAHDIKHDRRVALKVLLPELALAVRAERFLREIQIAAKLTHPHILALHDSGEVDGMPYYVMPFVEGESVRDRLVRDKQLPIEDAVSIAREVVDALGYAHQQGIVHRDVKPENILLHAGHALVADFGIARALTVAGSQTVTESGIAVGTPSYMSPEQGSGEAVDGRSDIYSLGCVLYEMLAGHPPFIGTNAQEILGRHAMDAVPSVRAARNAVPVAVEQTITKALAKQPADRFATAAEFAEALSRGAPAPPPWKRRRRLALAMLAAVLAFLFGVPVVRSLVFPRTDVRSLAVMPCENLTTDRDNVAFSQGMAEELISDLGRIDGLIVPALTSSVEAHKKDASPRGVARLLDVSNVLECSVRRAGGRIRITAHLVRAADERQLWSETYDRELSAMSDVITVQESIARSIVGALQLKLLEGGAPLARRSTENMAAHDLYLQGRHLWIQRVAASRSLAQRFFREAIALDTGYALAYAGLADTYWSSHALGGNLDSVTALEWAAAQKAVELDPKLAEGHAALGAARDWQGDSQGAEREFRQAIELNPGYAWAHALYALWLTQHLRFEDGLREAREAQRLDPFSGSVNPAIAMYRARSYDEAIAGAKSAIDVAPEYEGGYGVLGRASIMKGKFQEGTAALERSLAIKQGSIPMRRAWLAYGYARMGRRAQALRLLADLQENAMRKGTLPADVMAVAIAQLGLGENEEAVRTLQRPLAPGQYFNNSAIGGPEFDPIASDSRYQAILKKNLQFRG